MNTYSVMGSPPEKLGSGAKIYIVVRVDSTSVGLSSFWGTEAAINSKDAASDSPISFTAVTENL